jgi:hypothetical protein
MQARREDGGKMLKVSEMEARGSKTLVASEPMKRPNWPVWTLMKGFRILMLTVLWSGLGMGAGLFCGILGVAVSSAILHRSPDMDLAYRYIAIPIAICAGSCALLWNLMRAVQAAAQRRRGE